MIMMVLATLGFSAKAQTNDEQVENEDSLIAVSAKGFEKFLAATDLMTSSLCPRTYVTYKDNGEPLWIYCRERAYVIVEADGGLAWNKVSSSSYTYGAKVGFGYRIRDWDFRALAGVKRMEFGKLSDIDAQYLGLTLDVEALYDVFCWGPDEVNHLMIGLGLNYTMKRTYVEAGNYGFDFTGSKPEFSFIASYQRQWKTSGCSLEAGVRLMTDKEMGNGQTVWGLNAGVFFAFRYTISKKNIYGSRSAYKSAVWEVENYDSEED